MRQSVVQDQRALHIEIYIVSSMIEHHVPLAAIVEQISERAGKEQEAEELISLRLESREVFLQGSAIIAARESRFLQPLQCVESSFRLLATPFIARKLSVNSVDKVLRRI